MELLDEDVGTARGLERAGILYATGERRGPLGLYVSFNLEAWAYEYHKQHPDLLP